jgi:hypothetical protein
MQVVLECNMRQERGAVRVAYSLRNSSGGDVGAFNRLIVVGLDGTLRFPADAVYVDLEETTIHLRKMVLPIPAGLRMAEREAPYVSRLANGEVFREEFFVPAPITVSNPLRRAALAGASPGAEIVADNPRKAQSVTFSVGVFRAGSDVKFIPVSPAHPGVFRVWPPGPAVDRQTILTDTFRLGEPLTVMDYRAVARIESKA